MRHPNRKHKPKHHVKGNRTNILRQVKRVSLEVTHGHHYKEENGIECINRFSRYVTEKFLKRDRKVFKEYEWEVNDLNYPLLMGEKRFRPHKWSRVHMGRTREKFSALWKKIKKEREKNKKKYEMRLARQKKLNLAIRKKDN